MELARQELSSAVAELMYRFDNSALSISQNLKEMGILDVDSNSSGYPLSESGGFYTASYVNITIYNDKRNRFLMWWIAVNVFPDLFEISCEVNFSNLFTYDLFRQKSATLNEALKLVETAIEICLEDIEFSLEEKRFLELEAVEDQGNRTLLFHPLRSKS